MRPSVIGSILHGAYGDYYEQAICLKNFRLKNPDTRIRLFAAAPNRLAELKTLDFSWADCFELWTELPNHHIDRFLQFQVADEELQSDVFAHLPPEILVRIDRGKNLLPWRYLRSILPLTAEGQIGLSDMGRNALPNIMRENGILPGIFQSPTIGFLWRHRAPGGAFNPAFQSDSKKLVEKYSRLFRRLIQNCGCHVLICGMKVPRTSENKYRIDAKYPEYGLDLPAESSTHLKGLNWALELEILSRCSLCVTMASGFSEALCIKRGSGVLLVEPPPSYLFKALWHRSRLFDLHRPRAFVRAVASRRERPAFAEISRELEGLMRKPKTHAFTSVRNLAL